MIAQRKVAGCSDGYIMALGNIEVAYSYYGWTYSAPICRPVFDFNPNIGASQPIIGAFKVDGKDWVVSASGYYGDLPHPFLVSKFAKPKDRLPRKLFMELFMDAYVDALIVENHRVLERLQKGELTL